MTRCYAYFQVFSGGHLIQNDTFPPETSNTYSTSSKHNSLFNLNDIRCYAFSRYFQVFSDGGHLIQIYTFPLTRKSKYIAVNNSLFKYYIKQQHNTT